MKNFNVNELMKQAQSMQEQMEKDAAELNQTIYTGTAGAEVTIKINGAYEVQEVSIAKEMMSEDNTEVLQDMLLIAMNDVLQKISADRNEKLGKMAEGINIPGLK